MKWQARRTVLSSLPWRRDLRSVPETRAIQLRDGRWLAYTEWGDPRGTPIIHMHGMPGSRLEHEAPESVYRELGVRVITPDRPGYGLSDPQRRRRLVDWPRDVIELAGALDLDRFGIVTLSGGGIYGLVCAALIPKRVTVVVTTGCPAPMDRPGVTNGMRFLTRAGVWLGRKAPWLLEAMAVAVGGFGRRFPDRLVAWSNRDKPPPDRELLSRPSINLEATEALREALHRGPWGYIQDVRVLSDAWGFSIDDIRVPIRLWHGDQDTVIPLHHGRYLATHIPSAMLRVCPGEGHMLLWSHLGEILLEAAEPAPSSPLPMSSPEDARILNPR